MTQQALSDKHLASRSTDKSNTPLPGTISDSGSRIDFLERNLRYIQEQHNAVLVDLHDEISRLQQENRDLHYRLIKTDSSSSIDQKQRNSNKQSSPSPNKPLNENQINLKQRVEELEKQLIESEQKNKHIAYTLDELNKILASKSEVADTNTSNKNDIRVQIQTTNNETHDISTTTYENEQQHIHEIVKLRSALIEILNTEKLNVTSKILIRDCLTSTSVNQNVINKTTPTPIDMLYLDGNEQQGSVSSSSANGKNLLFRNELPVRRLNLAPPQIFAHRLVDQLRPIEQRVPLPPIASGNNSVLFQDSTDVNGSVNQSLSPKSDSQHQDSIKVTETSVARRERRTQELQKNRLMKTLFH